MNILLISSGSLVVSSNLQLQLKELVLISLGSLVSKRKGLDIVRELYSVCPIEKKSIIGSKYDRIFVSHIFNATYRER
jgi:hypothetical protein